MKEHEVRKIIEEYYNNGDIREIKGRLQSIHIRMLAEADATEDTRIREFCAELAVTQHKGTEVASEHIVETAEALYEFITGSKVNA